MTRALPDAGDRPHLQGPNGIAPAKSWLPWEVTLHRFWGLGCGRPGWGHWFHMQISHPIPRSPQVPAPDGTNSSPNLTQVEPACSGVSDLMETTHIEYG